MSSQQFSWVGYWRVALLAIALVGCGSKGTDGSGNGTGGGGGTPSYTFATSVDGGVSLSTLTTSQATQLCADVNAANAATLGPTDCSTANLAGALLDTNMYLQDNPGSSTATLQAICANFLTGLNSSPCPGTTTCDATTIATNSSACMATVSDIVTCINENQTETQDLLARFTQLRERLSEHPQPLLRRWRRLRDASARTDVGELRATERLVSESVLAPEDGPARVAEQSSPRPPMRADDAASRAAPAAPGSARPGGSKLQPPRALCPRALRALKVGRGQRLSST